MSFHVATSVPPSERIAGGAGRPVKGRESMDPITALHWDFERILKEIVSRIEAGDAGVNTPLPHRMSLEFPVPNRRPFDLFVAYLAKPGSIVARRGNLDVLIAADATRLTDQSAGLYFEAVDRTLRQSLGSPNPRPGEGPETLREVLRDIGAYLIARADREIAYGKTWRATLDAAGVSQYGYLTGPVANSVVSGTVAAGGTYGDGAWSLDTGHALLSAIVDAIGEGASAAFAEDLRARCAQAIDPSASRGDFELVNGQLLVAILGLSRFHRMNPHAPESLETVFGRESQEMARKLRAWSWLWVGGSTDGERPAARSFADLVLREAGWLRDWVRTADSGDSLLNAYRADATSFPTGLGRLAGRPALVPVAPSALAASAAPAQSKAGGDDAAAPATASADDPPDGFRLLELEEIYECRKPLEIAILGLGGVGKSTFANAVLHHLMDRRDELFGGGESLVLGDRAAKAIRDGTQGWREGRDIPPTREPVVVYELEVPRVASLRIVDHAGSCVELEGEPPQPPEDARAGDAQVLTTTMADADGIIVIVSTDAVCREASGEAVHPDERVPEVDTLADRLGRILRSRGSNHPAVAIVMNKFDTVVGRENHQAVYELGGAVFGKGISGGFVSRIRTKEIVEWTVRQPIAALSLGVQTAFVRTIEALAPIFSVLEAYTRRVELFFTSSLPFEHPERPASSDGPAAVLSWLLGELLPSFAAQATAEIARHREVVAGARREHEVVTQAVRLLAIDPRAGAMVALIPGSNKVIRKVRARRVTALNELLRKYDLKVEREPTNQELFRVRDRLAARIDHTSREIDALEARLKTFIARLRSA